MADIKYSISDLIDDPSKKIKVVILQGQLDESNVDAFAPNIYEMINSMEPSTSVIFDMQNLSYMNSKSIGYISDFYNQITAKSGKIIIAKAPSNVKDILNVVGLDQMIPLTQTMEEAKLMA